MKKNLLIIFTALFSLYSCGKNAIQLEGQKKAPADSFSTFGGVISSISSLIIPSAMADDIETCNSVKKTTSYVSLIATDIKGVESVICSTDYSESNLSYSLNVDSSKLKSNYPSSVISVRVYSKDANYDLKQAVTTSVDFINDSGIDISSESNFLSDTHKYQLGLKITAGERGDELSTSFRNNIKVTYDKNYIYKENSNLFSLAGYSILSVDGLISKYFSNSTSVDAKAIQTLTNYRGMSRIQFILQKNLELLELKQTITNADALLATFKFSVEDQNMINLPENSNAKTELIAMEKYMNAIRTVIATPPCFVCKMAAAPYDMTKDINYLSYVKYNTLFQK